MVGECLRNNTTLMLSLYLSLFLYSFALLQLGRGGATKLGLLVTVVPPFQRWSPSLLKTPASCRAQRVLSRSPCKSPTAFPIPPPFKSYNSKRERSRKRRRKKEDVCVFVCGFLSHWQRFFCWEPRQRWVVLLLHSRTRWAFLHQTQKCSRCHHHQLVLAHSSCLPSEP